LRELREGGRLAQLYNSLKRKRIIHADDRKTRGGQSEEQVAKEESGADTAGP
jgi:hypothetical protein